MSRKHQSRLPKANDSTNGKYAKYSDDEKKIPLSCIRESVTAGKPAKQLQRPRRTAYNWYETIKKNCMKYSLSKQCIRNGLRFLRNAHKDHIINCVDENPSTALDDMMTSHTNQFEGLHSEQIGSSRICGQKM
jgi:hypothetical protein